jgi:phospholipase C
MQKPKATIVASLCFITLVLMGMILSSPVSNATSSASPIKHVIIIMMENENFHDVMQTPAGPYEQQLAQQYASASRYYSITSAASLPNYLGIIGGYYFSFYNSNNNPGPYNGIKAKNLVDLLEAKGLTWKSYNQDIPKPCYLDDFGPSNYTVHHDPFVYFTDIRYNATRCANVVGFGPLFQDIASGNMPNFAFIVPNDFNNSHDTTIKFGDRWLSTFVPLITHSSFFSSTVLIITYDEPADPINGSGIANGKYSAYGGRVPLIVVSPFAKPGFVSTDPYDHYSTLATIEKIFGLPSLGRGDAVSEPMGEMFTIPL